MIKIKELTNENSRLKTRATVQQEQSEAEMIKLKRQLNTQTQQLKAIPQISTMLSNRFKVTLTQTFIHCYEFQGRWETLRLPQQLATFNIKNVRLGNHNIQLIFMKINVLNDKAESVPMMVQFIYTNQHRIPAIKIEVPPLSKGQHELSVCNTMCKLEGEAGKNRLVLPGLGPIHSTHSKHKQLKIGGMINMPRKKRSIEREIETAIMASIEPMNRVVLRTFSE